MVATVLRQPKNTMPKIKHIWAYLSVDPEDGNEGLCAAMIDGVFLPLIAADEKRLEILRGMAQEITEQARLNNMKIKLVQFTERVELETVGEH